MVKMEKILVKMEKVEKMEEILAVLEKIIVMIRCLLTSSTSPSPQRCAHCKLACEGPWLQVGTSMMSCKRFKQSCKVQVQRFYQRDKTKG